ncbi:heavy metal translocating P-type ATPase [Muricoccus radiodurans]|uniref:heavy metal translocating P-type ATPase n=1 Tax=Muricoccus radiodurans TaxID=2231721 RepID=UPI003CF38AD5
MSHIRPRPALAPASAPCDHCGAAVPPGGGRFCCAGCEGAHALIQGLGLDAFYRRRDAAAVQEGALRPADDPPPASLVHLVRPEGEGVHTIDLLVAGLTCGACVWLVEQALAGRPEVLRARASLVDRRLRLLWRGPAEVADELAARVARLGFRVAPWSAACLRVTEDAEGRALTRALGIAAFGAGNVMIVSLAVWFAGPSMGEATRGLMHWLAAAIGLPVIAVAGLPFYRSAWAALRAGRANMDLAVSLGVLAAAAMSLSEAVRNGPYTWFDSATTLLALLLAGRVLDRAARRRALGAVGELLALQGGEVTRLAPDGTAAPVAAERVEAGDRLLVAAGERLRLDGVLEAGEAVLDAAAATGESLPRRYAAGEALPAGGVNLGAPFVQRVTAAAADGSLARLARLLERAEAEKGRIATLADRAARLYVPIVHALAAAAFGLWLWLGVGWQAALVPAVATLIVTCPCGLAIAVPATRTVATGALFRRGLLVASGTALERLSEVDHAVLDKTGTLTEGRPVLLPDPARPEAALREAAGIARASRHPLARALVAACPDAPAACGVEETPGRGLACGPARLGSAAFLGLGEEGPGMTLWYRVAPGAAPVAFRFADRLRPDAAAAVAALERLGLSVELLSGDAAPAVAAAAEAAGIPAWHAGAAPEEKLARVAALRAAGRRVLMVGDGINDAGAMAVAHASASPAGATDVAQSAADLVLRGGDRGLLAVAEAVVAARGAQRIARGSVVFSLAYNVVAVPAAMVGWVTPLGAAVVMASSSLAVILNALRAGRVPVLRW